MMVLPEKIQVQIKQLQTEALHVGARPVCAFLYDLPGLVERVRWMKRYLPPRCELFYAIKANSELPLLAALAGEVDGFELSSGGELSWVQQLASVPPLVMSGPGKLDSELLQGLHQGVTLHVESMHELRRLLLLAEQEACQGKVLLRVNPRLADLPETRLMMGGKPTPFGLDEALLADALALLRSQRYLQLLGFHFHLLSHQLDGRAHLRMLQACVAAVERWCHHYDWDPRQLQHINIGGGLGVNYAQVGEDFPWESFCADLGDWLSSSTGVWGGKSIPLRFEVGRFISANCGYYACEVVDLKKAGAQHFAVLCGGTQHFRTPPAQGHDHPCIRVPREAWPYPLPRPGLELDTVVSPPEAGISLVGQLCTPKDVFSRNARLPGLQVGDTVVFPLAGAYGWHISHQQFLRHPPPQFIFLPLEDEP